MIAPIAHFAPLLEPRDYKALFAHYPASDFEADVANYEARKEEADPSVSVHFFRVSRIMRDLLFTCSSIDFGFEVARQTRGEKKDWEGVWLYALNQTILTPMLKMGGMPYAGAIHGSDTNYIFNGLSPELPIGDEDMRLSQEFSTAFLNFAHTGNPNGEGGLGGNWLPVFGDEGHFVDIGEHREMNIEVVGGPYGSGSVALRDDESNVRGEGSLEEQSQDTDYAAMDSPAIHIKKAKLESEKLFQRCRYIKSLDEKLGR